MSKIQINAVVLLILSIGWIAWAGTIPQTAHDYWIVEDFEAIPSDIGQWSTRQTETQYQPEGLPTASVLHRVYANDSGDITTLSIVYGASMGDLHQPEVCLGGQGWSTTDQTKITLNSGGNTFPAMLVWMRHESSGDERITIYWFDSSIGKAALLPWHKIKVYWARLQGRSTEGVALVRIMAPISDNEAKSRQTAIDFAQQISSHIDKMFSKAPKTAKL